MLTGSVTLPIFRAGGAESFPWSHLLLLGSDDLGLWLSTISTLDLLSAGSLLEVLVGSNTRDARVRFFEVKGRKENWICGKNKAVLLETMRMESFPAHLRRNTQH